MQSYDEKPATILLVEDDADAMAVLHETVVAAAGATVACRLARSGREALELVCAGGIEVVVSDVQMPEMSGLDLLQALGTNGFYQPFIVVTGLQSRDVAIQAIKLGAFDFIEKPLSVDKLGGPLAKAIRVGRAFVQLEEEVDRSQMAGASDDLRRAAFEVMKLRAMRFQRAG